MKNTTAKKFKYGSLSVVITVVFIALIIGVNLIVSSLDASFNLRVDLTETELYSISPAKILLSRIFTRHHLHIFNRYNINGIM